MLKFQAKRLYDFASDERRKRKRIEVNLLQRQIMTEDLNSDNSDAQMNKKLPFTLLIKKESGLEKLKAELAMRKAYRSVDHLENSVLVEKPCSSRSFWDAIEKPAFSSFKKEESEVIQNDLPLSLPFLVTASNFKAVPIVDTDKLTFCSYCFSVSDCADTEDQHGMLCPLEGFPELPQDYWPAGWPNVLSLSYRGFRCASADCSYETETSMDLQNHIKANHTTTDLEAYQERIGGSEEELKRSEDEAVVSEEVDELMSEDVRSENLFEQNSHEVKDCDSRNDAAMKQDFIINLDLGKILENDRYATDYLPSGSGAEFLQPGSHGSGTETMKLYKCGLCQSMTSDVRNIMQHYLHIHGIDKLFICEQCSFVSTYKGSLNKHWSRFHFPKDALPNAVTVLKESFDDSVMIKKGSLKIEFGLEKSEGKTDLPDHNITNYNNFLKNDCKYNRIKCKLCDYYTNTAKNMQHHIITKHITMISETLVNITENTTTYRCTTCQSVQKTKLLMASHYIGKHLTIKKVECPLCEKTFLDIPRLSQHCKTETHTDLYRRSLRCHKCLFATMKKISLQQHAIEHKPDFKCTQCSFKSKRNANLKLHVADVHNFKNRKDSDGLYRCDTENCNFSTRVKYDMLHHSRLHQSSSGEQPIPCEECGFLAASYAGYINHKKAHKRKEMKEKAAEKKES